MDRMAKYDLSQHKRHNSGKTQIYGQHSTYGDTPGSMFTSASPLSVWLRGMGTKAEEKGDSLPAEGGESEGGPFRVDGCVGSRALVGSTSFIISAAMLLCYDEQRCRQCKE